MDSKRDSVVCLLQVRNQPILALRLFYRPWGSSCTVKDKCCVAQNLVEAERPLILE